MPLVLAALAALGACRVRHKGKRGSGLGRGPERNRIRGIPDELPLTSPPCRCFIIMNSDNSPRALSRKCRQANLMQLESLKIFCEVVRWASFSRGAAEAGVSQSSASQAVHQLETRLGLKLIDRSKRPLVLTPQGKV